MYSCGGVVRRGHWIDSADRTICRLVEYRDKRGSLGFIGNPSFSPIDVERNSIPIFTILFDGHLVLMANQLFVKKFASDNELTIKLFGVNGIVDDAAIRNASEIQQIKYGYEPIFCSVFFRCGYVWSEWISGGLRATNKKYQANPAQSHFITSELELEDRQLFQGIHQISILLAFSGPNKADQH